MQKTPYRIVKEPETQRVLGLIGPAIAARLRCAGGCCAVGPKRSKVEGLPLK